MHIYSFAAWQQTSYIAMFLLGADGIEDTIFPPFLIRELLPGNALIKSVKIH
jgi:hypothetical protein